MPAWHVQAAHRLHALHQVPCRHILFGPRRLSLCRLPLHPCLECRADIVRCAATPASQSKWPFYVLYRSAPMSAAAVLQLCLECLTGLQHCCLPYHARLRCLYGMTCIGVGMITCACWVLHRYCHACRCAAAGYPQHAYARHSRDEDAPRLHTATVHVSSRHYTCAEARRTIQTVPRPHAPPTKKPLKPPTRSPRRPPSIAAPSPPLLNKALLSPPPDALAPGALDAPLLDAPKRLPCVGCVASCTQSCIRELLDARPASI